MELYGRLPYFTVYPPGAQRTAGFKRPPGVNGSYFKERPLFPLLKQAPGSIERRVYDQVENNERPGGQTVKYGNRIMFTNITLC